MELLLKCAVINRFSLLSLSLYNCQNKMFEISTFLSLGCTKRDIFSHLNYNYNNESDSEVINVPYPMHMSQRTPPNKNPITTT